MPELQPETEPAKKRSTLKKELNAYAELIQILVPLTTEQRQRLLRAATAFLNDEAAGEKVVPVWKDDKGMYPCDI